jgi:HTH-type transcriptional regulator / antitoxin HipB
MRVATIRDLAGAVEGRRKALGFSQAELARRAGVSRKWIYEFEGGNPNAALGHVLRVVDALDAALTFSDRRAVPAVVDLDRVLDEYGPRREDPR